jgi:hypothetical protein
MAPYPQKLGGFNRGWYLHVPLVVLLTLVATTAAAQHWRFRFPLWSCFAYTALIAAELAYYLR